MIKESGSSLSQDPAEGEILCRVNSDRTQAREVLRVLLVLTERSGVVLRGKVGC